MSLDLGFTQDVHVPEQYMQTPGSEFQPSQQRWVWHYEGEEMPLDTGATVRFKVREVVFPAFEDAQAKAAHHAGAAATCTASFKSVQSFAQVFLWGKQ